MFAIGIITGIADVLGWLFGQVASIAAAVAAALSAVWAVLGPILIAIWHALSFAWSGLIQPAWTFVKSWGERIWQLYTDHVKPIIDKVEGVVKTIRKTYQKLVAPLRDTLSVLEQFLHLTHLTNTAVGRWLDGELKGIDSKIGQVWSELMKPINQILHLLDTYILDAKGILQAPLLLESTAAYMGFIAQQWWEAGLGTITTDWKAYLAGKAAQQPTAPSFQAGAALMAGQPSYLDPHVDHAVAVFTLTAAADFTGLDDLVAQTAQASASGTG